MSPPYALAGSGATGVHMDRKAEFAAWLLARIDEAGLNQAKVARAIDVSRATLSRWTKADNTSFPAYKNAAALTRLLKSTPPGGLDQFADDEPPADAVEPVAASAAGARQWRVMDFSMQAAGYLPGDVVTIDARLAPLDGDAVIVELHAPGAPARRALRLWRAPGYILPAPYDPRFIEVHEAGKTAIVEGVVVETVRRRATC